MEEDLRRHAQLPARPDPVVPRCRRALRQLHGGAEDLAEEIIRSCAGFGAYFIGSNPILRDACRSSDDGVFPEIFAPPVPVLSRICPPYTSFLPPSLDPYSVCGAAQCRSPCRG